MEMYSYRSFLNTYTYKALLLGENASHRDHEPLSKKTSARYELTVLSCLQMIVPMQTNITSFSFALGFPPESDGRTCLMGLSHS